MEHEYALTQQLIEKNRNVINFGQFGVGPPIEWIEHAQLELETQFPPSYVWWLKNYKGGEIHGDEIYSVYDPAFSRIPGGDIVFMNVLYRQRGYLTPERLVIQHNDQGEDYFFDTTQVDENGENPVYVSPPNIKYAENFLDFLRKKIEENVD